MSIPGAYENGGPTPWPKDPPQIAGAIVGCLLLLTLFFCGFAVMVKRLHDRDKAWWWLLVFIIAPDILSVLRQYLLQDAPPNSGGAPFLLALASLALFAWGFVELGFLPGAKGDNRFGPDPLA